MTTLYRCRQYGKVDWTQIMVNDPSYEEEDSESVEAEVTQIIGSALDTSALHVQKMNDDGEWEDLS